MNQIFSLSESQQTLLTKWENEQNQEVKDSRKNAALQGGPIGGICTYSFTPTSLGVIITVKNALTEKEIDLTNYDEW